MTERNAYSETENKVDDVVIEQKSPLIYKISDSPPIYLTIFFAFQVGILLYNCFEKSEFPPGGVFKNRNI